MALLSQGEASCYPATMTTSSGDPRGPAASYVKRAMDVVGALAGLLLFGLPMLIVVVLIRQRMGSPVLFRQVRPGLKGEPFTLYKFRTMRDATGGDGRPLPDAERLTAFGQLLRSTSLDELPELWNVLRGNMSLVGPRPLLIHYLDLYSPLQARRHEARPGLTGLSQVMGRNAQTWERKLALDVQYIDEWNLWLDIKILLRTMSAVLKRDGITQPGSATAEEFRGQTG
ncbi:sugar transferase [soil metagenome]